MSAAGGHGPGVGADTGRTPSGFYVAFLVEVPDGRYVEELVGKKYMAKGGKVVGEVKSAANGIVHLKYGMHEGTETDDVVLGIVRRSRQSGWKGEPFENFV